MKILCSILAAVLCAFSTQTLAELKIVAIGDMPYGAADKSHPRFKRLIAEINKTGPDLVIHVGDILDGETLCISDVHKPLIGMLNTIQAPVVFTPGDNDWSDCNRDKAGGFNQLKRLTRLRDVYFPAPGQSLGAKPTKLSYEKGSKFVENVRWVKDDVHVLTLHVVGPNDARKLEGKKVSKSKAKKAFKARRKANLAWLQKSFQAAKDARAVVVALHADLFDYREGQGFYKGDQTWPESSPFKEIGDAIEREARAFGKPVLLIHGSGHEYTVSWPFWKTSPQLMAVEVFGEDEMHAVHVTVEDKPTRFNLRKIINHASDW